MKKSENKIQERFESIDDAFNRATELAKTNDYVCVIQSVDDMRTEYPKIAFYVENENPFVRTWEKMEHEWENGKLIHPTERN